MEDTDILETNRNALEKAFGDAQGSLPAQPSFGQQIETVPLGAQRVAVHRDEAKILAKVKAFAAAAGDSWYYQWETKNKDGSRGLVEGASIDCALYVLRTYGNCDVDVRVQDGNTHWIFYARFTDFETGFRLTRAYAQRKNQQTGMKDADRQADIVFQIGQSKAIRNVVTNALRPFTDFGYQEAQHGLIDKVQHKIEHYRTKVNSSLQSLNITVDRVERRIGRTIDKWLARDIAQVIGEITSVKDGMMHAEDMWPALIAQGERPKKEDFDKTGEGGGTQPSTQAAADQGSNEGRTDGKPESPKAETNRPPAAKTDEGGKASSQTADPPVSDRQARQDQASGEAAGTAQRQDQPPATAKAAESKPADVKQAEPPSYPPAPQGVQADWWTDQMKAVTAANSIKAVERVEDEFDRALANDPEALKVARAVCNAKCREIYARGTKKR